MRPAGASYGNADRDLPEVAVVRAIYDAFARRDVEGAIAHISDDCVFNPQGTASRLGRGEPYVGHAGLRQYFTDVERVWDDLRLHADDIRGVAGSVVVFGHVEGRTGGQPFRSRAIWNWKVRDGRAVSMRATGLGSGEP